MSFNFSTPAFSLGSIFGNTSNLLGGSTHWQLPRIQFPSVRDIPGGSSHTWSWNDCFGGNDEHPVVIDESVDGGDVVSDGDAHPQDEEYSDDSTVDGDVSSDATDVTDATDVDAGSDTDAFYPEEEFIEEGAVDYVADDVYSTDPLNTLTDALVSFDVGGDADFSKLDLQDSGIAQYIAESY